MYDSVLQRVTYLRVSYVTGAHRSAWQYIAVCYIFVCILRAYKLVL